MDVSKNRGVGKPPKWMVKIMVPNPMNKWDDLVVFPIFLGQHLHVVFQNPPVTCLEMRGQGVGWGVFGTPTNPRYLG